MTTKIKSFNKMAKAGWSMCVDRKLLALIFMIFTSMQLQARLVTGYQVLWMFQGAVNDGSAPMSSLTEITSLTEATNFNIGNPLFGATSAGGAGYGGTVYEILPDGAFYQIIGDLKLTNSTPVCTFVSQGDDMIGVCDGSAGSGGEVIAYQFHTNIIPQLAYSDGTIRLGGANNLYTLHSFTNGDGIEPLGDVFALPSMSPSPAFLVGTTALGGVNDGDTISYGTIYRVNTDGTGYQILHSFVNTTGNDGEAPWGGPTQVSSAIIGGDSFYIVGTTTLGGTAGNGVIYSMFISGSTGSDYQILHNFDDGTYPDDGTDPRGSLLDVHDTNYFTNNIYGVTHGGGDPSFGAGIVFKIDNSGNYSILHRFNDGDEGGHPYGALTYYNNAIYGTTTASDAQSNYGTLFKIDLSNTNFSVIHVFGGSSLGDGANPAFGLLLYTNVSGAWLYGTTLYGGTNNNGIIFVQTLQIFTNNFTPIMLSPPEGQVFLDPNNIAISIASSNITAGSRIAFFADYSLLGTVTNTPYTYNWTNPAAGGYTISVAVVNTNGVTIGSAEVDISVSTSYPNTIVGFAGNHTDAYSGDGGQATNAALEGPYCTAIDNSGNVYIADASASVIRKVDPSGIITTVAGKHSLGPGYSGDGGPATNAALRYPEGIAVDGSGDLYIADTWNNVIRMVDTNGTITTVAGNYALGGDYSGDGGPAVDAALYVPMGIAVDSSRNIYISDCYNNVIRKVDAGGTITTIVGTFGGGYGGDGGPATNAAIDNPMGITLDHSGNLYFADNGNNIVRKVDVGGNITTVAGDYYLAEDYSGDGGPATNAALWNPYGVAVDSSGNIYFSDSANDVIRKVVNGNISTVAGNYTLGGGYSGDGGSVTNAAFALPYGVTLDSSNRLYITDSQNGVIRFCPN